jgi:GNAT superfamily N-acetyltransferase
LVIGRAAIDDAETIADLHIRAWQWAYRGQLPEAYLAALSADIPRRASGWQRAITNAGTDDRVWVAAREGRVLGFCSTSPTRDVDASPGTAEVAAIYLSEDAAGTGMGRALFSYAVTDLVARGFVRVTLWVLESNARARRFYEIAGWAPDGATRVEQRPDVTLREMRYQIAFERVLPPGAPAGHDAPDAGIP